MYFSANFAFFNKNIIMGTYLEIEGGKKLFGEIVNQTSKTNEGFYDMSAIGCFEY